jgi:hypothetical protein
MNTDKPTILGLIDAVVGAALMVVVATSFMTTGCKTATFQSVVTPARVQSVVALGSFYGARTVILHGERDKIESAKSALATLDASESADWVAIAAALKSGGLTFIESGEGSLVLQAASAMFSDEYGPDKLLDSSYGRAVVKGALRGVTAALESYPVAVGSTRSIIVIGDRIGWESILLSEAKATRPEKR